MIEHLSAEQISQWIIGDRPLELQEHVAECVACRAELGQLENAISQFRTAMREAASYEPPPAWRQPEPRPAPWFSWPRLVLTATALLVLAAVPVTWRMRVHEQALRAQAAQTALADSQLLESVDAEISQAVPQPMEPLVTLATWNSSSTEQNEKAQRQ